MDGVKKDKALALLTCLQMLGSTRGTNVRVLRGVATRRTACPPRTLYREDLSFLHKVNRNSRDIIGTSPAPPVSLSQQSPIVAMNELGHSIVEKVEYSK